MLNNIKNEIVNDLIELGYNKQDIFNSIDNVNQRLLWNINSNVYIYSRTKNNWFNAEIINIIVNDETNEEWLKVKYSQNNKKQIQRFSKDIKSIHCKYEYNHKIIQFILDRLKQYELNTESKEDNSDILIMIQQNKGNLFDISKTEEHDINKCIGRIKFILLIYSKWILNNENGKHIIYNHNKSMFELITNYLNPKQYNYYSFLSDYRIAINIKKDLISNDNICPASKCITINRNERDRQYFGKYADKRSKLYYQTDEEIEKEEMDINISVQQILDDLHSYIYHTVYINAQEIEQNKDIIKNLQDLDIDHLCDDLYMTKICKMIENKRKTSMRYRTRERNETGDDNYNKFQTTNTYTFSGTKYMKIVQNAKQKCFVDVLLSAIKKSGITEKQFTLIDNFIYSESYDSDSIAFDLKDINSSNFINILNDSKKFKEISNKLIHERKIKKKLYSSGKRYFYWKFYKNNTDKRNAVFEGAMGNQSFYESNEGYNLCDWYVEKKYENFKMELLNNLICQFTLEQYRNTLIKMLSEEEVDGECLKAVEISDINRWGIKNFKHSKELLKHIKILSDNQEGEIERSQEEGDEKTTRRESAVYFEINENEYNEQDNKEDILLDEMLSDILKMESLDPNKIHEMNVNNVIDKQNNDSDSENSDNMYE
eukprot:363682_1